MQEIEKTAAKVNSSANDLLARLSLVVRTLATTACQVAGLVLFAGRSATVALLTWFVVAPSPVAAQVVTTCGCSGSPVILADALDNDEVTAVVQAWVALAEGSPRAMGEGVHPDQEHPHPWMRYLMIVERSWKKDLQSFWIERPWGRCGSPLWPGYRYVLTLPASEPDSAASVVAGESAFTVGSCQEVKPLSEAGAEMAAFGPPKSEYDLKERAGPEMSKHLQSLVQARGYCRSGLPGSEAPKATSVKMVPGSWTKFEIDAPSVKKTWQLAQNGTSSEGRDEVLLFAENPGACWLRVTPQVTRRWASEDSARRVLGSSAGLTWRPGWVPPYWRGTLSMGSLPWIREAEVKVESSATAPAVRNPNFTTIESASSRELKIESLDPAPGSYVNESTRVRVRLRWVGEISEGNAMQVQPMLQAENQMLVLARERPPAEAMRFTKDKKVLDFEFLVPAEQVKILRKPLQVRFMVNRSADASDQGQIMDSTKPIEYLWGTEPRLDPVPPPKRGPWYAGGAGDGCSDAIVVRGVGSIQEGIAAERAWWRKEYPGSEMASQGVSTPLEEGDPAYDLITLKLADGQTKELCFEITEFWGAPARPQRRPPP